MKVIKKFYLPDYYEKFKCKCGSCRHTCCQGWNVTLSISEYYRLINLDCSKSFRKILERAFHVIKGATNERYAYISKSQNADCIFHDSDGLCLLQKNYGLKILSKICCNYPRNLMSLHENECSCSNSCEEVLELLFSNDDKISFTYQEIITEKESITYPIKYYHEIREKIFNIIENRDISLIQRFYNIGLFLENVEISKKNNYEEEVVNKPHEFKLYSFETDYSFDIGIIKNMMLMFKNGHTDSDLFEVIDGMIDLDNLENEYLEAKKHLETVFPNMDIMFEKLFCNHIFFTSFPFCMIYGQFESEFYALCGTYAFVKFICAIYMTDKDKLTDFVDINSKLFRLIDHTAFYQSEKIFLDQFDCNSFEKIMKLINL